MSVFIFVLMTVLCVTWWNTMSMGMAGRSMLVAVFDINDSLLLFIIVVIGANRGAYATTHCTTNNCAFTTADFGTDCRTHTTTDGTTQYCTGIHCACRSGDT